MNILIRLVFIFSFWAMGTVFSQEIEFPIRAISYPAEYARENKTYLNKGDITPLLFYFEGDKNKLENPQLIIECPPNIHIKYAFCPNYWTYAAIELNLNCEKKSKNIIYTIPLDIKHFKKNMPISFSVFDPVVVCIFMEAESIAKKSLKMTWHIENAGASGKEKNIEIKILPPLKPFHQKYFKQYCYRNNLLKAPDEEIFSSIISLYKKLGLNGGLENSGKTAARINKRLELFSEASTGFWGGGWWGVQAKEMAPNGKTEEILVTLKNGKKTKNKNAICQSWLLMNSEFYEKKLKTNLEKYYFKGFTNGFVNDYELDIFTDIAWPNSCFCPRCLSAFAKFAKLDKNEIQGYSPKEILSKYKKEWQSFRYQQNGAIIRSYNAAVKSLNPSLKTILCSIEVCKNRSNNYHAIDPREYDQYVDEHWPMIYTQSPDFYNRIGLTVSSLKKPVIPCTTTCFPIGEENVWPPWLLRLNAIATASLGGKGICHFPGLIGMDGEYFAAICQINKDLSFVGEFYKGNRLQKNEELKITSTAILHEEIKGKIYRYPDLKNFIHGNIHCNKGNRLITVFNYHSELPAYINLQVPRIPDGNYVIYDPVSKNGFSMRKTNIKWNGAKIREGFLFKIPPKEVKFLVIENFSNDKTITFPAIETILELKKQKQEEISSFSDTQPPKGLLWSSNLSDSRRVKFHGTQVCTVNGNKVFSFKEKNDYVEITNESFPEKIVDSFTLEFMVLPEKFKKGKNIDLITKKDSFNIFWFSSTDVVSCSIYHNKKRRWLDNQNFLKPEKWNYVALTYGNGYIRLYHNGKEINQYYTGKLTVDDSSFPILISSKQSQFHGKIRNINIYNKSLKGEILWKNYIEQFKSL